MHCTTRCERSEINRDQAVLLINSTTRCLASWSSPEVKMTVRGLFGEKSCLQSIGMLLMDLASRAPGAISATISLELRPFNAARDLVTPARLMSGTGSTCAFVASVRMRPRQATLESVSHTHQSAARMRTSQSAGRLRPIASPRSVGSSVVIMRPLCVAEPLDSESFARHKHQRIEIAATAAHLSRRTGG